MRHGLNGLHVSGALHAFGCAVCCAVVFAVPCCVLGVGVVSVLLSCVWLAVELIGCRLPDAASIFAGWASDSSACWRAPLRASLSSGNITRRRCDAQLQRCCVIGGRSVPHTSRCTVVRNTAAHHAAVCARDCAWSQRCNASSWLLDGAVDQARARLRSSIIGSVPGVAASAYSHPPGTTSSRRCAVWQRRTGQSSIGQQHAVCLAADALAQQGSFHRTHGQDTPPKRRRLRTPSPAARQARRHEWSRMRAFELPDRHDAVS
ncbi:hypothetical protein [Xanthomonas euvesicatoria]|uniref:hypothetical protein n=1 Tax=Xanthomonas euvesicatoria TaxID=456327 RepID=UPI001C47A7CA|nr:hypothetical protein [Xanthomonas euvesicatoria]